MSLRQTCQLSFKNSSAYFRRARPNNSFKPKPLRYTKGMAEKACHAFGSTTQFGLTQALAADQAMSPLREKHMPIWLWIAFITLLAPVSAGCATPDLPAPAAPPRECLLIRHAWCIEGGPYEIVMQRANRSESPGFDWVWVLRGDFRPESKLVLFEPYGCKDGFADSLVALSYDKRVIWRDREWDRMRVRLRSDASCDLDILVPPFDGDPMEWAYSSGFGLIRACSNVSCEGPLLADLRDAFNPQFKRTNTP
ncbi:hypothetical protein [Lysobacter sp. A421]